MLVIVVATVGGLLFILIVLVVIAICVLIFRGRKIKENGECVLTAEFEEDRLSKKTTYLYTTCSHTVFLTVFLTALWCNIHNCSMWIDIIMYIYIQSDICTTVLHPTWHSLSCYC